MPEGTPESHVIDIPGETSLFRTANLAPVRITLPLSAGPAKLRSLAFIALVGLPAAFFILIFCIAVGLALNPPTPDDSVGGIILMVMLAVPCVWTGGLTVMAAADLIRGAPALVLDVEGFWDMRLKHAILWKEVERAQIAVHRRTYVRGVQLTLHKPIGARHNGFRWGAASDFIRRGPDEVFVPLRLLDVHAFVAAHAMTTLIERAGGRLVES